MIVQLDGDNSPVPWRRIRYDVCEVAVQGNQNRVKLLGLCNNMWIGGVPRHYVSEHNNVMRRSAK